MLLAIWLYGLKNVDSVSRTYTTAAPELTDRTAAVPAACWVVCTTWQPHSCSCSAVPSTARALEQLKDKRKATAHTTCNFRRGSKNGSHMTAVWVVLAIIVNTSIVDGYADLPSDLV